MNRHELNKHQKMGLLDYKWKTRFYLTDYTDISNRELIDYAISSFVYLIKNKDKIRKDKSLYVVCQICADIDHIVDIDHYDKQLSYLSHLFNQLTHSGRELHMCYDCGTLARGVLFQLINAYRGQFKITHEEIDRIKDEYYMDKYKKDDGVYVLEKRVHNIQQNCIFMCAIQMGENFGHIYILEKIYINKRPRFRIYQSCFNAYLLIDYIECMDYANDVSFGIDVKQHLMDLHKLYTKSVWGHDEVKLFIDWFKFYPDSGLSERDKKLFTSTYILL